MLTFNQDEDEDQEVIGSVESVPRRKPNFESKIEESDEDQDQDVHQDQDQDWVVIIVKIIFIYLFLF